MLALQNAENEAEANHRRAQSLALQPLQLVEEGISALASHLRLWPETNVNSRPSGAAAVPEEERQRSPGVPGEEIHYQNGYQCCAEHLPLPSANLIVSAALQVLDGERLRLHALVVIERLHEAGIESVGAAEVTIFNAKLEARGRPLGILIAASGPFCRPPDPLPRSEGRAWW
ncbi:hypothetical protein [Streptomyces exfoliatus]|uniref:hypothetical protein n=1 Tax=Streptomyces exfoliatus TaxID=1905 RepID=UPI00378A5AE8